MVGWSDKYANLVERKVYLTISEIEALARDLGKIKDKDYELVDWDFDLDGEVALKFKASLTFRKESPISDESPVSSTES